jgi:hypothetical protein
LWLLHFDAARVGRFADLLGANLSHAILSDADLSTADLTAADLSGTVLRRANLAGANLYRANLTDAGTSVNNLALDSRLNDVTWSSQTTWPSPRAQAVIEDRSREINTGLFRINSIPEESNSDSDFRGTSEYPDAAAPDASPAPKARRAGVGRDDDDDGGEGALLPV